MEDITAARIREKRIARGMSQNDLAIECGYKNRASINKIESDARNVTLDKLKVIADALHTTPDYLMGWSDDPILKDEKIKRINQLFDMMTDDQKDAFIKMVESIVLKESK